jgi:hypothetical protein
LNAAEHSNEPSANGAVKMKRPPACSVWERQLMTAVCIAFAIWLLLVAAVLIFPALARIVGVLGRGPSPVSPRHSAWGKLSSRDHVGHVELLPRAGQDPVHLR